ncbi:hypothetical protein GCM10020331_024260 [Ectobacillus funiculus]
MRTWNYTKMVNLQPVLMKKAFPIFQFKIQGWNDNHHFSDVEDVVTLKAVIQNGGELSCCFKVFMRLKMH